MVLNINIINMICIDERMSTERHFTHKNVTHIDKIAIFSQHMDRNRTFVRLVHGSWHCAKNVQDARTKCAI